MVDSLRTILGERMVLVDGGNIHGYQNTDAANREAGFIAKMMNRQKYDVSVLGPKDFQLPDSVRRDLLAAAEFPWLGSNYKDEQRPKGVQDVWIKKVDGLKVGFFSFVDPSWAANNLKAEQLEDNLMAIATDLRKRCDVVAMVAFTSHQDPESLARRLNGLVDVMIMGGVNSPWMTAKKEGSVNIGNSGDRGRHIARFDLLFNRDKKLVSSDYQVVILGHDMPNDPVVTQLMADFTVEQGRAKAANLERMRLAKLAELKMDPAKMPGENSLFTYTGEKDCRDCHMPQYNSWRQTVHGRAFSDLIRNRESDQDVKVRRAVTGWLEKTGFVDRRESSHLYNVQCESCHGRGSEHVKTKGGALESLIKPETTCFDCHNPKDQPDFNLAEALKMVHPPLPEVPKDPLGQVPASKSGVTGATLAPGGKADLSNTAPKSPAGQAPTNSQPGKATSPVVAPAPPPPPGVKKN